MGSDIRELWQQAVQGDKTAENAIFEHLRERFTVIAGLTIYGEDAGDVAHDACLAVLKGYKDLGSPFEYGAWAQRILKNKIANYFQRRSLEKRVFVAFDYHELSSAYHTEAEYTHVVSILERCLKKLAAAYPHYARVLFLKQAGDDTDTICHKMEVTRNNLYVLLNRGRKYLRDCIFDGKSE